MSASRMGCAFSPLEERVVCLAQPSSNAWSMLDLFVTDFAAVSGCAIAL